MRSRKRRGLIGRLILLLALAVLAAAGWLAWYAHEPADGATPAEAQTFSIPRGATLRAVAADLAAAGLVRHPAAFVWLARLRGQSTGVRAGSYLLGSDMTPLGILTRITEGDVHLARITVVEGWTFRQLRQAVDEHPALNHDTANLSDAHLLESLGMAGEHPEGRFFPDTYFFDAGSSDLALYRRAAQTMTDRLASAWAGRAPGLPLGGPYQALILASIIEKETGVPEERPLIAAVFVNRLRLGMRLQTDPTVIYGLGADFDGNLRKADLLADTPYNTYTRAGLPPTPIALPGWEALRAAVNPDGSRALYFVAKGGGRHHFSETLNEHNRAVARYQRGR